MIYIPRRGDTPWIVAWATMLSRGQVVTMSLPVEEDPYGPMTWATYRRPGRLISVTAGPYQTAVGKPDWRVLDRTGSPIFIGGDAWDVAQYLASAARYGVILGKCSTQADLDAAHEEARRENYEDTYRRCDLWLLAYRTGPRKASR